MGYKQLSTEERYAIGAYRTQGLKPDQIAKKLGRHRSTIYREVARNKTRLQGAYCVSEAVEKTIGRRSRSRRNLHFQQSHFEAIEDQVRQKLSPQQIVGNANRREQKVMSHETIYRWIWRDHKRGGDLWTHLRCARKQKRKRYGRYDSRGRLAGKRMITERPKIVDERSRIGDWEIDTVHGSDKASILTIVERRSGFVLIGKLTRATAQITHAATVRLLLPYLDRLTTITSDNGSEFHSYKLTEQALGIPYYFATPHHAWERGTNENTNGLIRQYFPKGSSFSSVTQADCDDVAKALNDRPRRRLHYLTPLEVFSRKESVALQS